jgi:hypothetical protein
VGSRIRVKKLEYPFDLRAAGAKCIFYISVSRWVTVKQIHVEEEKRRITAPVARVCICHSSTREGIYIRKDIGCLETNVKVEQVRNAIRSTASRDVDFLTSSQCQDFTCLLNIEHKKRCGCGCLETNVRVWQVMASAPQLAAMLIC